MMEAEFRLATIADLPEIVRIYNQAVLTRQSNADLEPVSLDDRKGWFLAHNKQTRPIWVISLETQIIGWVSLSDFFSSRPAYHKTVEISIYLDQAFQGRHLATTTLNYVENEVKNFDIETIIALIFAHNKPSLRLFEKFGYDKWGYLPKVTELDGITRDVVILGKRYK